MKESIRLGRSPASATGVDSNSVQDASRSAEVVPIGQVSGKDGLFSVQLQTRNSSWESANRLGSSLPSMSSSPETSGRELLVAGQLEIVRAASAAEAAQLWATSSALGVAWLQPGDRIQPEAAERIVAQFQAAPDCDVVYGNARLLTREGALLDHFHPRQPNPRLLARRFCLLPSSTFIRRTSLDKFGTLDDRWHYWAAYEHWLRLAQQGADFQHLDFVLADRVMTPGNPLLSDVDLEEIPMACDELTDLLRSSLGSVSVSWAIWMGRAIAASQGIGRPSSRAYDRIVLGVAQDALQTNLDFSTVGNLHLWLKHLGSEGLVLLRSPALARRLLRSSEEPSRLSGWFRDFCSPNLFRLQRHAPRPGVLTRPPRASRAAAVDSQLPSIALVTPNYNCGQFIERTLQSVLEQNYPRLSYHIQDGGSTDDSLPIVQLYADRLSSWESVRDRGQSDAINRGFARVEGAVMGWLNSDDMLLPGALQRVGEFFARHPEVDVVYGHRLLIDAEDQVINRWILPRHDNELIRWADYIPQETMFWRRELWDRCGSRVDDEFQFAMDWELILRFRRAGARFHRLPHFLGAFRITDTQKTSQLLASTGLRESNRLREAELGFVPSDGEVQRRLRSYIRRHWWTDKWYGLGEQLGFLERV